MGAIDIIRALAEVEATAGTMEAGLPVAMDTLSRGVGDGAVLGHGVADSVQAGAHQAGGLLLFHSSASQVIAWYIVVLYYICYSFLYE